MRHFAGGEVAAETLQRLGTPEGELALAHAVVFLACAAKSNAAYKAFNEAMLKAGNRSQLDINEGGAHGYLMRDKLLFDDTMKKTDSFLKSLGLLP